MAEKEYISLKDLYIEKLVPCIQDIKIILKDYFGEERFDFTVTKNNSFLNELNNKDLKDTESNKRFLSRSFKKLGTEFSNWFNIVAYTIIIHFPHLTVKNSHENVEEIKDLYIRIRLSPFLTAIVTDYGSFFEGMVTSYTQRHWEAGYNFSHMALTADQLRFSKFCLGSTHFSTLCGALHVEYESNNFTLFCQQLPDYLSWESLEGVPYKKMSDINNRDLTFTETRIGNNDLREYLKSYLQLNFKPNYKVESNEVYYKITIEADDDFRKDVTSLVTVDQHFQNWDPVLKKYVNRNLSLSSDRSAQIMESHPEILFQFKEKPVKLSIDKNVQIIDNGEKVANYKIINFILDTINNEIKNKIDHEFKERNYTTR